MSDTTKGKTQTQSAAVTATTFRGHFTHTLDDKGRLSLPASFRSVLSEGEDQAVVITNYISEGSRCLEGFTLSAWTALEAKLRQKSRFSQKLQKLENFYLSRASECPVDTNGRILLPQYLRIYAGIDKEATFTSSLHGFRVWDRRVWDATFAAAEQALIENPEIFADVDV